MKQKATAVEIARSLGSRVGSVKAKARELRLVPLKMRERPSIRADLSPSPFGGFRHPRTSHH